MNLADLNLEDCTPRELLALHSGAQELLREQHILRSANNPTGDLAEYLFCNAFPEWRQESNSRANFDAIDQDEKTYQIKGRRITRHNNSRQLSAFRNLNGGHFDYLAGVLFNEDYSVRKAALIPYEIVKKLSKPDKHTNSHRFLLRDNIWDAPNVRDVTRELQQVPFG